jgi:uncharacterized protein YndB with AHSA1/START domain
MRNAWPPAERDFADDEFLPAVRSICVQPLRPLEASLSDTYDVVSTREFAAPAAEVWRAWSDPDYVTRWWGPAGFTSPHADLDFRVGGTSLVCMRAPAEFGSQDLCNTWTYRRIEPFGLIEFDLAFIDPSETRVEPPPGVPSEVRHVVTLTPLPGGRTSMTVTEFGYPGEQMRDQSKAGLEQCLDKMAVLLENRS